MVLTIRIQPARTVLEFDLHTAGKLVHPIVVLPSGAADLNLEAVDERINAAIAAIVSTIEAETDIDVIAGQPLLMLPNGHLTVAQADAIASARVCGLAIADAFATTAASYSADGLVDRDDWTAIVGTIDLAPGATYYLSPLEPGKLTPIAPTESGQIVAAIGTALNARTLAIELQPLILL